MKMVKSGHIIMYPAYPYEWNREYRLIELAGRTAYKSEEKITEDSAMGFIGRIMKRGHLAVIEFGNMVVKFATDRGITHELVRHRLCSFVQESTRYCNYANGQFDEQITIVKPSGYERWCGEDQLIFLEGCQKAEAHYMGLLKRGHSPQEARAVLPNATKAEIVIKANFREWRHIFQLRAIEKAAHPDMRALMIPLYRKCRKICPEIFDLGDPQ